MDVIPINNICHDILHVNIIIKVISYGLLTGRFCNCDSQKKIQLPFENTLLLACCGRTSGSISTSLPFEMNNLVSIVLIIHALMLNFS